MWVIGYITILSLTILAIKENAHVNCKKKKKEEEYKVTYLVCPNCKMHKGAPKYEGDYFCIFILYTFLYFHYCEVLKVQFLVVG